MKVLDVFRAGYFWDADLNELSWNDDMYIIEKVLSGSLNLERDLPLLEKHYSKSKIIYIAINSTQIYGNEDIEFIASRYKIKPNSFQKYLTNVS